MVPPGGAQPEALPNPNLPVASPRMASKVQVRAQEAVAQPNQPPGLTTPYPSARKLGPQPLVLIAAWGA